MTLISLSNNNMICYTVAVHRLLMVKWKQK